MAHIDLALDVAGGRQAAQVLEMLTGEPGGDESVDDVELRRRTLEEVAVVVAGNGREGPLHEEVDRTHRVKRAAHQVTEIEDGIDATLRDVGLHSLEGQAVAMDIGDDGDLHALPLLL